LRALGWPRSFLPAGVSRSDGPGADQTEELWRTYDANIFNSARVKVRAMQAETPKKYWRNLPEARSSRRFCATRRNGSRR
jgi:uracil-DNA glycosylase